MDDSDIIAELKKEPASELRRLQHMPYAWKLQHAIDVVHEFVEHDNDEDRMAKRWIKPTRADKKKCKKAYPHHCAWKKPMKDRKYRLHKCPVCKATLRKGCFNACRGCLWVLEYRKVLEGFLVDARSIMHGRGTECRWMFHGYSMVIFVEAKVACDVKHVDRTERTGLDRAVNGGTSTHCEMRVFTVQKEFSLISLKQSLDPKGILKDELVNMFKAVWEKATSVVDRNMRAYAVGGVMFPVQGNWRDRHG